MSIAAIPNYLQTQDFSQASPGLRFNMYLSLWGINQRTRERLWTTADIAYDDRGQNHQEREVKKENKTHALQQACKLTKYDKAAMQALAGRQACMATNTQHVLTLDATATAPFTTGLGNEHPLENGFAFLNPYGLPYLPGSGIKGVLRQAARELASGEWGDCQGWTNEKIHLLTQHGRAAIELTMLDALFGLETGNGGTQHVRGALHFWDVIPQISGDSLAVDIMTPHQGHYYQQTANSKTGDSANPHDSGQPNPLSFLTLPPGTQFIFHVQCDSAHLERLAPDMAADNHWRSLLTAAFEHAFEWLGFGAKTSVGYGAMLSAAQQQREKESALQQQQAEKARQAIEAEQRRQENAIAWLGARIKFNRANGALSVEKSGQTAIAITPKGQELLQTLPTDTQQKIKSGQFVKVNAHVAEGILLRVENA
ncbi:type III-B CRISPR module RAMP protein Cmr6 [Kerstersia gyiorum]|uniref:type III-B CRISPR module RAMP protein Cmr6 n=1 Tax=Kerstersia gyiorum TaxID=206506 RepID=UPI003B428A9D